MSVGPESRNNYSVIMRVVNTAGYLVEREHLDIRPRLVNTSFPDNQQFIPSQQDNWSQIAWKKLGDGQRWWIVADFSGVIDPFLDLLPALKFNYLTQLSADAGVGYTTQITVKDPKRLSMGMLILVEDLTFLQPSSGSLTSQVGVSGSELGLTQILGNPSTLSGAFVTSIIAVNNQTGVVDVQPITVNSPGVPAALSRVSQILQVSPQLTCPSVQRAFFETQQFSNPLNVLTE